MRPASSHSDVDKKLYWKLPYTRESEQCTNNTVRFINKIIPNNTRVFAAYQTRKTSSFFPNKDKVSKWLASNIVYKYKCVECDGSSYTGETKRHLITRASEHCSGKPIPTELSFHQHEVKKERFQILLRTKFTKIAETLVLNTIPPGERLNEAATSTTIKLFTLT